MPGKQSCNITPHQTTPCYHNHNHTTPQSVTACSKSIPYHISNKSPAVAEVSDHLATIGMGRKWGGAAVGAGSPSNTMWPGPRPTAFLFTKWHLDPSNCLATTVGMSHSSAKEYAYGLFLSLAYHILAYKSKNLGQFCPLKIEGVDLYAGHSMSAYLP